MKFQQLLLFCVCGRAASRIKQVGLTADHQLVIHWWCSPCRKNVYAVKALSDCWRDCLRPEDVQDMWRISESSSDQARNLDQRFLRNLGVRLPEETES